MTDLRLLIGLQALSMIGTVLVVSLIARGSYSWAIDDELDVFMTGEEFDQKYRGFGGYLPDFLGALWGIAWGVIFEVLGALAVVAVVLFLDPLGMNHLIQYAGKVVFGGAALSYGLYLEFQANIRETGWYRGY